MLHSAGIFADIACPFFRRGLCDRPHCVYKHADEDQDMFGNLYESSVTKVSGHHPTPINGATVDTDNQVKCFLELERINKEIETVKNEVEKEQRRLSHYQTVQVDSRSKGWKNALDKSKTKGVNGNSTRQSSRKHSTKPYSSAKKYMVDNSRPRTDLEYDPLSNFSADLRPSSSTGKEQKVKCCAKRTRDSDQKKSPSTQLVDESEEEGVLIIDVPLSPNKNISRHPKLCRSYSAAPQEDPEEVKEVQPSPAVAELPSSISTSLEAVKVKSSVLVSVEVSEVNNKCSTDNGNSLQVSLEPENESVPNDVTVFDDLSKCLEDLRNESQKLACYKDPEPMKQNLSETIPDCQKGSASLQTYRRIDPVVGGNVLLLVTESGLVESDLPNITFREMNPAQPNEVSCVNLNDYSLCSSYPTFLPLSQDQRVEQPAQSMVQSYWSPMQSAPLVSCFPKIPSQTHNVSFSTSNSALPSNYLEQAAATAGIKLCQPPQVPSTSGQSSMANGEPLPSTPIQQPVLETEGGELEAVRSVAEEELNYSDVDLSDSDPMEECYKIFMEAKREEEAKSTERLFVPLAKNSTEAGLKRKATSGTRKRMAHVSKHIETVAKSQSVARSRLQTQTIVPLRGPGPASVHQVVNSSRIQQLQHKACQLTAALKGGQAFVSSATQRNVVTLAPPIAQTPPPLATSTVTQPLQNVNYLPVGTAIQVGNNLHFILPEGSYTLPMASIASHVTSVITPVQTSQVAPTHTNDSIQATPLNLYHPSPVTPVHTYHPTQVTPIHAYHSTTTTHVPVKAQTSPSPLVYTTLVTTAPQPAAYVPAKPVSTKRKVKQRPEVGAKVPHDVRQRYVNMFVEEFLKTSTTVQKAFEKALAEEKTVYERSVNKLKYMSVAVNALKRLKNQSTSSAKAENETSVQQLKGSIPLNVKALKGNDDTALYASLKEHILTEEMLAENNYPLQHPENPGSAILFADTKKSIFDALKRICCRCGATYSVGQTGKHARKEECTYHYGKGVEKKVPGGVETRYSCCEGVVGAPGCQVFKLHVHDAVSLDGFVSTLPRTFLEKDCPGVYSVDCEMCYTTHGLELSRVTVVNSSVQVVYDTFVRPDHEVIDYNTRFSSVSEKDLKGTSLTIRDVQETLLKFIMADTILIGHKLETDLCALKLLHATVVDTSVVFPHRLGPPHKLTLHHLTADYLRKIIQESVCGHDTAEDAAACMELMLGKVKEDGKARRW